MQLLKAKTGKIIHAQEQHRDGTPGTAGVCICGKAGLLPVEQGAADVAVEKGGAYCPAALGALNEPQDSAPDARVGQTEIQAFAAEMDNNRDATLPPTHADGLHRLEQSYALNRHQPMDTNTKKVRGFRLRHKAKKTKRPRQYAGMNMSAVHQHARMSNRKKAPASLWTHRAFQDVPGGLMMIQPIGGGEMRLARKRDKTTVQGTKADER